MSTPPPDEVVGFDPDEHWERTHRAARRAELKTRVAVGAVIAGFLVVGGLMVFASQNQGEPVPTSDEVLPHDTGEGDGPATPRRTTTTLTPDDGGAADSTVTAPTLPPLPPVYIPLPGEPPMTYTVPTLGPTPD